MAEPGTGIGVAIAGRATPLMRPMRSRALAIVAPVLPALTIAEARPSRTASAARTSDESFMVRTLLAGSASMAMTSEASMIVEPADVTELVGPADQHDVDAELVAGRERAGDDLAGCVVAAHRVEGDREWFSHRCHLRVGARAGLPAWAGPTDQLTSMAWRPWYQPQLPHTTWGSLAEPQRGQTERAGTLTVQADARRLRLLALEVFFLGTATVVFLC